MKSTLRKHIATAALLLVPAGALLGVQPAFAQHRDHDGPRWQHRDREAPQINGVTPSQGSRVSERGVVHIAARYDDDRSGVDLRSVTLRVDGRDVTNRARLDDNDIRYTDNLRPGRHFAELVVRDRAGNVARRAWSFDVRNDVRGNQYGYGYGRDGDYRR